MTKRTAFALAAIFASSAAAAQDQAISPAPPAPAATGDDKVVCQYVLTAEHGSKPYRLCLTKADWKRTRAVGGNDPNRIECHIMEDPATKLTSYKVCQPASQWQQDRQDARDFVQGIQMKSCVTGGPC